MNQVTLLWQEVLSALGLGLMLALVFDLAYYVSERFKEG